MSTFRSVIVGIAVAASLAVASAPALADPEAVEQAREDLARIQQEASAIDQQIIEASARAEQSQQRLTGITEDLEQQRSKVSQISDALGEIAVMQMQSNGLDLTAQLLTGDSEHTFLEDLATIHNETARANADIQAFQLEQARLDELQDEAERTNEAMQADLTRQQKLAADYDTKVAEAEAVFNRLEAEEAERLREEQEKRERQEQQAAQDAADRLAQQGLIQDPAEPSGEPVSAQGDSTNQPAIGGASGRAAEAVRYAMSRVGSAYVWGASGPNSFDCSGFTSWAFRQIGISLPRSSRAQTGAGTPVNKSDLRPGDLVFFYSPVSHVAIYIGDGQIVDAANPRRGVRVTSLDSMPYSGARRVA